MFWWKEKYIYKSQIKLGSFSELTSSCLFINRSITLFMAFEPLCLLDEFTLNRETKIHPRGCSGKESACQRRRPRFDPSVRKIFWRKKCQPTPVFLPGESHGHKSQTWLSDCTATTKYEVKQLSLHKMLYFWAQKKNISLI